MSQIEELNLTIPDALDIEEQQRVLIENFSLLRDLCVTSGYIHFDRHKETSDTLSTTYLQIINYDHKSTWRKKIDVVLTTGVFNTELNGVYTFNVFLHVEGSASNTYIIALRDGTTVLASYEFDAHDPGGHVYMHHELIYEFSDIMDDLNFAIKLASGSSSVDVVHFHVSINRVDNYDILN